MFGLNCVQFGDCPAAPLMIISVERGAETHEEIAKDLNLPASKVKEDSKKLLHYFYVDNGMMRVKGRKLIE